MELGAARRLAALLGAALLAATLVVGLMPQTQAATGDLGYRGPSFAGVSNPPTAEKPQSKLWWNDGSWWAVMYDAGTKDWRIKRLDRATETWVSTGVPADTRATSLPDVLWNGTKLYVASHYVTVSTDSAPKPAVAKPAYLYRYSYDAATRTYSLDAGFPSQISGMSTEAMTIDQDTTGRLWATWTQVSGSGTAGWTNQVYYASSADGATWTAPTVFADPGATVAPDDISAVVAFGRSRIGVLWSNQTDGTVYWAVRRDGAALDDWRVSPAVRGTKRSDDHMNLKTLQSDTQGRVWAAVKTSYDELPGATSSTPQIQLLQFKPGTGSWTATTFGTLADCQTRPVVVLDEENQVVHVFATAPVSSGCPYTGSPGAIYEKSAPMSGPVFPAGRGTPVMLDSTSPNLNNVTASKQPVNSRTGIVVMASDMKTSLYWHADLAVPAATSTSPTPTPTDTTSPAPTPTPTDTTSPTPTPTDTTSPTPTPTPTPLLVQRAGVATSETTTAASNVTINRPAGTAAGDVLVSCLVLNGGRVATNGAPAGWSPLATGGAIANPKVYGYYRIAGPSEPASYQWTLGSAVTSSGGIARYVGAAGLDSTVSTASGASSTAPTVPGVTTATAGAMLVGCMGINSGATTITMDPPLTMSEAWDLGGKRQDYGDELRPLAGDTGPRTWSVSAGREWSGWLTALKPAG